MYSDSETPDVLKLVMLDRTPISYTPIEPKIKVSPYAKFDKFHKNNKKKK